MAFVFTVETGAGLADANSYCSVATADDYFAIQPSAEAWTALTTQQKEYYLALATRYLDQKVDWRGIIATDEQALRWPRVGTYTRDRVAISSVIVPRAVQSATCEMAYFLLTNDPNAGQDVDNLKKVVVDVLEIEFQDRTTQPKIPSIINAILTGLGYFVSGSRGYGKILRS